MSNNQEVVSGTEIPQVSLSTKFAYTPRTVSIYQEQEGTVQEELVPGIYELKQSMAGFYLEIKGKNFGMPPKLYGNIQPRADKILAAYSRRAKSTGVMLLGDKGCGKTELMKLTANDAVNKLGLPVIQITEPYAGAGLQAFLASCGPVCLIFDEFAKIYERYATEDQKGDAQADLLSMFDGFGTHKNLNIITENDKSKINSYMKNRPGRFYYRWEYGKLDIAVIEEYCIEKGVTTRFLADLVNARNSSDMFSFDILQAVVAEHLAYPAEEFKDIVADMNVDVKEPKYELHFKNVNSVLIETGLLELENSKIHSFDRKSNSRNYSNTVRLRATKSALNKFESIDDLRDIIQLLTESSIAGDKEKVNEIIKAIEEMPKLTKEQLDDQNFNAYSTLYSFYVNKSICLYEKDNNFVHYDKSLDMEVSSEAVLAEDDVYQVGDYNKYADRF